MTAIKRFCPSHNTRFRLGLYLQPAHHTVHSQNIVLGGSDRHRVLHDHLSSRALHPMGTYRINLKRQYWDDESIHLSFGAQNFKSSKMNKSFQNTELFAASSSRCVQLCSCNLTLPIDASQMILKGIFCLFLSFNKNIQVTVVIYLLFEKEIKIADVK